MSRNLKILIVIPVHNSGLNLPALAEAVLSTGYDLLVIDDGSDDAPLRTLADLPCETLRINKRRGEGAAILQGAEQAAQRGYDAIVVMSGDGRDNPAAIDLLVAEAEQHQTPCLVIGARQTEQAGANFWVRLECGLELPDTESTFRLYPVKELLAAKLTPSRFAIETIVKLAWAGVAVSSVPVPTTCPAKDQRRNHVERITENLGMIWLHGRLVIRRLLPWPHRRLIAEEPLRQKVYESISQNPLKVLGKICNEHNSPLWLAIAVWLGIFMGALPLLAIHTISIIYVAHRLHINKVTAVAASQFCTPPFVPVLCIQMGYYLRHGELLLDFSWQRWLLEVHERFWEWLIGSLLIGPLLGLIGAGIMYWMAARIQTHKAMKNQAT